MEKIYFSIDISNLFYYNKIIMKELNENICNFIPSSPSLGDIHILHLVHEAKIQRFDGWKSIAYYRIHYVVSGEGVLRTHNGDYKLSKNDVFFCLPSMPFAIQSMKDFKYVYISFIGERANAIFQKYKISANNCVFKNYDILEELWNKTIKLPLEISDVFAEGVVLSTMSLIASETLQFDKVKKTPHAAALIKKFIDENFSNADLSLESICKTFSYNDKYISKIFKKEFKVSFKEYLTAIRINNACALMDKGFTSVKDIAFLCGFNDPLYFSKVFKIAMNHSPREYINIVK